MRVDKDYSPIREILEVVGGSVLQFGLVRLGCCMVLLMLAIFMGFMDAKIDVLDEEIQALNARLDTLATQTEIIQNELNIYNQQHAYQLQAILDRIDQIPAFEPWDIPLEPELQAYTYGRCLSTGIDPELVFAIMEHESGFDPSAVGYNHNGTVDVGLMQINSVNWDWLAARGIDVHTVEGGIDGGILMLYELMAKYPDRQALAAYAAGEAGMLRGWGYWFAEELIG